MIRRRLLGLALFSMGIGMLLVIMFAGNTILLSLLSLGIGFYLLCY